MKQLNEQGYYKVDTELIEKIETFWADWSDQEETLRPLNAYIRIIIMYPILTGSGVDVYDKYVITTGDLTSTVTLSTASPFKFNQSVCKALFNDDGPIIKMSLNYWSC